MGISQLRPIESHASSTALAALPSAMMPTGLPHASNSAVMPASGSAPARAAQALQLPGATMPILGGGSKSGFSPLKAPAGISGSNSGPSIGAPAPLMIPTGHPGSGIGSAPVPQEMGRNTGGKHGTHSGADDGPAPVRAGRRGPGVSGESYGPISIIPSAGSETSGSSNKDLNLDGKKGDFYSPHCVVNVDFTKYMSDLQRRIKRSWFPAKDTQSLRIKVMFKIHSDGQMSNLRLSAPSHNAVADQAALNAVQNASPFAALPPGAPENVDIEFTFDYNVFSGR